MYWPTPQDYNEAVQNPEYSFADQELIEGAPELTPLGLPKPVTGNFASVYRFQSGQKLVAVKCFLRNVHDQMQRYQHLSRFMQVKSTAHMVDCQYIAEGIRVKTDWYPILKMDWIEGVMLDQHLRKQVGNKASMEKLLNQFSRLVQDLKELGIAHGDLQHGNIIVQPSDLKLVDYDGMFVPSLAGQSANELGHPNYQHPERSSENFSSSLDDFSAWLIYSSLFILTIEPMLFKNYDGGDECILFRQPDLKNPENSRLIRELVNHPNEEIKARGELIKRLSQCPINKVPPFREQMPALDSIPRELRIDAVTSSEKKSALPDWMLPDVATATVSERKTVSKVSARPIPAHLKQAPRLPQDIKWPTLEQYEKAVLKPASSFKDQELAKSNPLVRIKIIGKHGIVYQISTKEKIFAVKCFIDELTDRLKRYEEIEKVAKGPLRKYFVDFDYFDDGIKIEDHWFPCLKMNWQQGETLDQYAGKMISTNNKDALDKLIVDFRNMMLDFLNNGIAHGDLEPANILIDSAGAIKLVDYDAMFTPFLKDLPCGEAGNPIYQHPSRNANHFGAWLDNFPALLIDSVLTAMTATSSAGQSAQWDACLKKLRPRSWSQSDPRSPVTRRSRLLKDMQMTKMENVPPLNAAIKL